MIEVIGREDCVWCSRAKNLLESNNLEYTYLSIPEDLSLEDFKTRFPGRRTVPQIVVNGNLLDDGFSSLAEIIDTL